MLKRALPRSASLFVISRELVRALVRELHRHDRLARRRVEVLARSGELEVVASHLGHRLHAVRGLELAVAHEIEEVAGRVLDVDARADDLADSAREHDGLRRYAEDLPALRQLALLAGCRDHLALEQLVLLGHRAGDVSSCWRRRGTRTRSCPPRRGPAGRRAARRAMRSPPGSSGRRSRAARGSPRGRRAPAARSGRGSRSLAPGS